MIVKELDPFASEDKYEKAGRAAEENVAFYLKRFYQDDPSIHVLNSIRIEMDDDAAPGAVHQPADVGGQLLRLRPRQQHAVVERVQVAVFRDPAPALDQLLMHHRDLPGRAAEADETQLEPILESLSQ